MNNNLKLILFCLLSLVGCTEQTCEIRSICIRNNIGNYILKWETNPPMEGTMRFYVSDTPNSFNMSQPAGYADIKDEVTTYITQDNLKRKFFRLTFNGHHQQDIAARHTLMDSIQNFRDEGGYKNSKGKKIKWGKIYRSGFIGKYTDRDSIRISDAGIKTIIDLRTEEEVIENPLFFPHIRIVHIPIQAGNRADILQRLKDNKVRSRDGFLFMEDIYIKFVTQSTDDFAQILQLFVDENNYPILVQDDLGKDRAGYLLSLVMMLLDIPYETVVKDYMESNRYINPLFMSNEVKSLSWDAQEALTVMLSTNESFLEVAYNEIDRKYGSFKAFRGEGLLFSTKNKEKLKDILLE